MPRTRDARRYVLRGAHGWEPRSRSSSRLGRHDETATPRVGRRVEMAGREPLALGDRVGEGIVVTICAGVLGAGRDPAQGCLSAGGPHATRKGPDDVVPDPSLDPLPA